jgi:hypothetical protein
MLNNTVFRNIDLEALHICGSFVIITAKTPSTFLEILQSILLCISDWGLTIEASACHFAVDRSMMNSLLENEVIPMTHAELVAYSNEHAHVVPSTQETDGHNNVSDNDTLSNYSLEENNHDNVPLPPTPVHHDVHEETVSSFTSANHSVNNLEPPTAVLDDTFISPQKKLRSGVIDLHDYESYESEDSWEVENDDAFPIIPVELIDPDSYLSYLHYKYGDPLTDRDIDNMTVTASVPFSNIKLLFGTFRMNIEVNEFTHILVIVDAGSLKTRIKAIRITQESDDIISGLADYMSLNGLFTSFYGMFIDNPHPLITGALKLLKVDPIFEISHEDEDFHVIFGSCQTALDTIESYMYSEDANRYEWMDTIYWAMHAMEKGIEFRNSRASDTFSISRSATFVALQDIKRRFKLQTSNLFLIADHRIFQNYTEQLFVRLYIDFDFTSEGISDWQPLTPRIENSAAFALYAATSPEVKQWLFKRSQLQNSI